MIKFKPFFLLTFKWWNKNTDKSNSLTISHQADEIAQSSWYSCASHRRWQSQSSSQLVDTWIQISLFVTTSRLPLRYGTHSDNKSARYISILVKAHCKNKRIYREVNTNFVNKRIWIHWFRTKIPGTLRARHVDKAIDLKKHCDFFGTTQWCARNNGRKNTLFITVIKF